MKNDIYPTDVSNKTLEKLVKNKSKFKVDQGTVCFKTENGLLAAFIPMSQRVETVLRYHRDSGHTRSRNLYLFMQDKAWWPGMIKDIQDILKRCKTYKKHTSTPLPSKSVIPHDDGKPFDQWAINIIGPMPPNKQDKKFIITAIDFCTRWPIAQATKAHDGNYIRRFIGGEIGKKFGYPKRILTDCGKEFVLKDTRANLSDRNVQLITTTPYHPQANGCVERLNGVLLSALRKLSSEDPLSWPKHLPTALLMARSRVNRDIHFSPFEMVYGYKAEIQELPNSL